MVALLVAFSVFGLAGAASSPDPTDPSPDIEGHIPSVDISLHKSFEFATLSTGGPKQPSTKILSAVGLSDLNRLAETRLKEMEQYAQDALTNKVLLAREEMKSSRQRFQAVADAVAADVEARTARLEQQWLQLAVASGHGQVGKCCCAQDKDCAWHNFAAGGDRDCPVGMQDYRDRVKPGAKGLTSSGAVDTLLAQCVNSTGWTERPWAPPGAPAGGRATEGGPDDQKQPATEPDIEVTEGPGRQGAAPAKPEEEEDEEEAKDPWPKPEKPARPDELVEELRDGTVLLPGGAGAAAPAKPEDEDATDAIHVELHVELPADEDVINRDHELLEQVIPGGSLVTPDFPPLISEAPAVEEEAPLVTPAKPEEEDEDEVKPGKPATPYESPEDDDEEEEEEVKPGKLVKLDVEEEDPPVKPGKLVKLDVEEEDPPVKPGELVKLDVEEEDPPVKPSELVKLDVVEEDPPVKPEEDAMGRPMPVEFPDGSSATPDQDDEATLVKPGSPKPEDAEGEPEDEEMLATPELPVTVPGDGPGDLPGSTDSEKVEEVEMPLRPGDVPGSHGSGLPPPQPDPARDASGEAPALGDAPWDAPGAPEEEGEEMREVLGGGRGGGARDASGEAPALGDAPLDAPGAPEEEGEEMREVPGNVPSSGGLAGPLAQEPATLEKTTLETNTPCDCDDEETVHVKITAVLTPKGSALGGGSLAQRAAHGGRRHGSGCDCSGGRSGIAPPVHVELAGPESSPVSAVASALSAAVAAPDRIA